MLLFAVSGMLVGALLGARTVAALITAVILALVIAGVSSLVGGETFAPTTLDLALLLICLQVGYLGGAAVRFTFYRGSGRGLERSSSGQPPSKVGTR